MGEGLKIFLPIRIKNHCSYENMSGIGRPREKHLKRCAMVIF
jgi:hypothetical protein